MLFWRPPFSQGHLATSPNSHLKSLFELRVKLVKAALQIGGGDPEITRNYPIETLGILCQSRNPALADAGSQRAYQLDSFFNIELSPGH
jgi:hypothetical protein